MERYIEPFLRSLEPVLIALVNRSLTALWLVAVVAVLRLLFKKAPKSLHCVLWGLVALRLIVPLSIQSPFSAYQASRHVTEESGEVEYVRYVGSGIEPAAADAPITIAEETKEAQNDCMPSLVAAWIAGMAILLGCAFASFLRLRRRVAASLPLDDGTWMCDDIDTPFILGMVRPRIYLPSCMEEARRELVIAHERAHLARRDHWWKPLGFALLSVYWFNPGLWLAYILLCRDIEFACDERVLRELGSEAKKPYSETLLACSVPRRAISACPVAFGEVGVKERVKAALHYKKPAFWIVALAVAACAIAAVCFLTDPKTGEDKPVPEDVSADYSLEQAKADGYDPEYPDEPLARLTLDDVRALAKKGEALSARDFDGYEYIETGSGLYIKLYPIDERLSVWLGFAAEGEPMYFNLRAKMSDVSDYDTVDLRTGDVEAFLDAHAEPPYRTEGTVFTYHGEAYDLTEQNPAVNAITQVRRAGQYYVIEGHVNPNNGVYCVFDTETERFIKTLVGANLTWQGDDLATAVYSFWNEILDYEENTIAVCDLAEGEYIYSLGFDDDGAVLAAIMGTDGTLREERCPRSGEPVAQAEMTPSVYAAAPSVSEVPIETIAKAVDEFSVEAADGLIATPTAGAADEPENSMVVVIDLMEYEGGEEP